MFAGFFEFILVKGGRYAWWMFGAFLFSAALLLIPNLVVTPMLRDYASNSNVPAIAILSAYGTAANYALTLFYIVIAIAVVLQFFFFIRAAVKNIRHFFFTFILLIVFLGSFGALVVFIDVLAYGTFAERAAEDIQQIEDGELETAIIHLSTRRVNPRILGPFDILLDYESPINRVSAIRPNEGMGWEGFVIPNQLEFVPNTEREFSDSRNSAQNLEYAQLYKVVFTSNLKLVYSIEEVTAEYFLGQRPLPEPRGVGDIDSAFFGTWHYENDAEWVVEFHENGGGLRDIHGENLFFSWGILEISGDYILDLTIETGFGRSTSEGWRFEVTDDYMWLQSTRAGASERTYVRVR